jgi:hypothetical protein
MQCRPSEPPLNAEEEPGFAAVIVPSQPINVVGVAFQALDSVGVEIRPVQKPEKQNCRQNHDNEKQPAQKPDLPLVLRKPSFSSMSVHKKCQIKPLPNPMHELPCPISSPGSHVTKGGVFV